MAVARLVAWPVVHEMLMDGLFEAMVQEIADEEIEWENDPSSYIEARFLDHQASERDYDVVDIGHQGEGDDDDLYE